MKKIISAIFLTLIALVQVHAQNSELRSAPDLPTFKVTLNYSSANTDQGTIATTTPSGTKVAYNSTPVFTITAKAGYVLSDLKANTASVTLPAGTFNTNGTTTYSYTSAPLTARTDIQAVFKSKESVSISVASASATLDEVKANVNLPNVTFNPAIAGQKVVYKSGSTQSETLPEKVGTYTIIATSPETAQQAAASSEFPFEITPAHTLTYSFKVAEGSVSATMDNSPIASGGEIAYGKTAVFKIMSNPGFVLSKLLVDNKEVALPIGTFNSTTNKTVYADYATGVLKASTVVDVQFVAKKAVTVTASPLSATKDEIAAGKNLPKVTFTPNTIAGQTTKYKNASGQLTNVLPAVEGKYTIVATSPETSEYAALNDESMTFTISKANLLNYSVTPANQGTITAQMDGTDTPSGSEIKNGKTAVLTIIAKQGYTLSEIKLNGVVVNLPIGTFNEDNTITYTYETAPLTASATLSATLTAKKAITASVTGSSATKDEIAAGKNLPIIEFTPKLQGQTIVYRATDGKETTSLPVEVGVYQIVLHSPETSEYAALNDATKTFTINKANTLTYTVDGGNGSVAAKMNGKDIKSEEDIINGYPAIFTIISDANYKLGRIMNGINSIDIKDIKGVYANGHTTYTYTTESITATAIYAFTFASKDTVKFVANNLTQTVGSVNPVTYTSTKSDIKVEYKVNGQWVTEFPDALAVGPYAVRFSRPEDLENRSLLEEATLVVESKQDVKDLVLPTPGRIEEGQALSASTLIGGTATGSFIWKAPNEIASPNKKQYDLIFEPNDPVHYAAKDTFIALNVVPVYTINVSAGANGSVVLEGRSANDKYANGSVLKARAIANKNYKFAKWSDNNTAIERDIQANANMDITANFEAINYAVTVNAPTNGTLTVFANGNEVKTGTNLLQGTILTITATPSANHMVKAVKVNGALVNNGSYVLTQAASVTAEFVEKPQTQFLIKVGQLNNGGLNLIKADTKAPITPGEAIETGVKVKVITKADYGYELDEVTVTGATYDGSNGTFTVGSKDVTVNAAFKLTNYTVNANVNIEKAGTIVLKNSEGKTVESGSSVPYSTQLTASVTSEEGYRFINMMMNSSEIKGGAEFTVSGPVNITANYVEKKALEIDKAPQTLVYNKEARNFIVKVAGYSGLDFNVAYSQNGVTLKENPKSAGTYTVQITREEDDLFKKVNVESQLVIEKAGIAFLEEPTIQITANGAYEIVSAKLTQDYNKVKWNPTQTRSTIEGKVKENQVNTLNVNPLDEHNYEGVNYSIPVGTVETASLETSNAEVRNGGLLISDYSKIPVNTVLTLKAVAPNKEQRFKSWSNNVTNADKSKMEITVTLSENAIYTPTFEEKPKLNVNTDELAFDYDGSIHLVTLDKILTGNYPTDVTIKYTNANGSVATPLNAGTYLVTATRTGDDNWQSFTATKKLEIKKAKVATITAPTATTITEGQPLSESILSGGVAKVADGTTIRGTFEWSNPGDVLEPGDNQGKAVIFKSYDSNYEDATTTSNVTVKQSETLAITFSQPENGTLKVYTLNANNEKTEITTGVTVAQDTKISIEASANNYYELVKIMVGEQEHKSSPVTMEVKASLAIMAEFRLSPTPPSQDVPVTGVALNVTSKTIAVGESFALIATVAPTNATIKSVTWSSSDETIATVDANGIVTALKEGACQITVATDDGNKTASCALTVSKSVSIEQILNDHKVYTGQGEIIVNPIRPISIQVIAVTGSMVYNSSIANSTRISVPTGIYMVKLIENGKHATAKVNVR